jgi:hypothetical protein
MIGTPKIKDVAEPASDFNTKIIEEFRANGGKVGGRFANGNLLLLHHTGARSGTEPVRARVAGPSGRDQMWARQVQLAPHFADYQRSAFPRTIPVVVLDPVQLHLPGGRSLR